MEVSHSFHIRLVRQSQPPRLAFPLLPVGDLCLSKELLRIAIRQRLYLSEQFNEEARSPFVKKYKTQLYTQLRKRQVCGSVKLHPGDQEHISASTTDPVSAGSIIKNKSPSGGNNDKAADSPSVGPRGIFQGHEDTVEDVQFCPSSAQEFCSVGDDSCLILWDARVGTSPAVKVEKAHNADLHCVDWNPHDQNYILTGSADNSVRMFDRRSLTSGGVGSPVHKFEGHKAAVLCVQWSPDKASVFGSAAEDALLNIWDFNKVGEQGTTPGLFFQHAGHRDKVVDFHWNASDPWTVVSVSDDCGTSGGGGTLQIWRMSDLIYRPEEEVLAELEKFKSHVIECTARS